MTGPGSGPSGPPGPPGPPAGGPARWLLLSLASPPAGEAFLLVDALRRLGARSVERDGERVAALFPPHPDPAELAADATVAARASTSLTDPAVSWSWVDGHASAARLRPDLARRRVTDRIVVAASDDRADEDRPGDDRDDDGRPDDDVILRLDPSTAFGTAEHPTTRSCLRLLDGLVADGHRVLDVGAGSAILSIAAVLLGAGRADALEADPIACDAARQNVALNGVEGRVRVRQTRVAPGSLRRRPRYDGVVANLQAEILRPLISDLAAVSPGGWVVLAGALRPERDAVARSAEAVGLRLEAEEWEDGWWTGQFSR